MFKRYRIWMLAVGLYYCLGVNAKPLHLVTTEWETFTSDGSHSARLNDFVQQAFARLLALASILVSTMAELILLISTLNKRDFPTHSGTSR
jgi:hypothetical protein